MFNDEKGFEELTDCLNDTTPETETTAENHENGNNGNGQNTQIKHEYTVFSLGEFLQDLTPVEYLIQDWIQANGLNMIFGESASYKTFCAVDMCASIACPDIELWAGKEIEHGDVVYFAGEGISGLKKRFAGWCLENGKSPQDIPLYIIPEAFALDDTSPEYCVENTIANIRAHSEKPALVVLDTLNRYMSGDENSATDMGQFIRACSRLTHELGCAVLIIHHSGLAQEAKGRARGSGALFNAMDISIHCVKSSMTCTLSQTKNKEARLASPLVFSMREVEIPNVRDRRGNLVKCTTLTPEYDSERTETAITAEIEQAKEKAKPKLSENKFFSRRMYQQAAIEYGRIVVDDETTGHESIWLDVEDWRKVYYENSAADTPGGKRVNFNKARKEMAESTTTLNIKNQEGRVYYCLDLSNDEIDMATRAAIQVGIRAREKREQAEAEKASATERTGELFKSNSPSENCA